MSWNKDRLMYYRSEYLLQQNGGQYTDSTIADIDTRYDPTDPVQAALYDSTFSHQPFPTRIRAGAQLRAGPVLVTGDLMLRVTQGAVLSQPQRLSGAAELPLGGVFALRGGLATDFDGGITYGGGMGFKGGPVHFDLATNITPSGTRKGVTLGLGLSIN
jgi:hypothetical protein